MNEEICSLKYLKICNLIAFLGLKLDWIFYLLNKWKTAIVMTSVKFIPKIVQR